jgi:hypothetical protein
MPTQNLNILVVPTYKLTTLMIVDASTYEGTPSNPTIEICPPGFETAVLPFTVNDYNIFTSINLGISPAIQPLPDGIYHIKYSIAPAFENFVEQSIMRVDKLQERFDEAFMKLDMMECDRAIKTQEKVTLNTIYFLIQGSIAAANNCALTNAMALYQEASDMLDTFMKQDCGCSGTNFLTNFR